MSPSTSASSDACTKPMTEFGMPWALLYPIAIPSSSTRSGLASRSVRGEDWPEPLSGDIGRRLGLLANRHAEAKRGAQVIHLMWQWRGGPATQPSRDRFETGLVD